MSRCLPAGRSRPDKPAWGPTPILPGSALRESDPAFFASPHYHSRSWGGIMKTLVAFALALFFTATAFANPALHGTWSAANVQGRPLKIEFAADKTGKINGAPMRWDTLGGALFIQQNGQTAAYGFKVDGNKLLVSGGDLAQPATLTKGSGAYDVAMKARPAVAP